MLGPVQFGMVIMEKLCKATLARSFPTHFESAMNPPTSTPKQRQTTNVIAASGRLRNEHFLLTADRLTLELDQGNFELVSAKAEGNIQVHMNAAEAEGELVIYAASAVFRPERQRLNLRGWIGTRENGLDVPAPIARHELAIPTDGTLFIPLMQEQKRPSIKLGDLRAAA